MPDLPASTVEAWEVLDLLTGLVGKSLVLYEEQGGEGRYRLLETVRQYTRDRLLEAGDAEDVRERHRDWFLALAEQGEWESETARLDRLETEHDNLRAALAWSGAQGQGEEGLRLGGTLYWFWRSRGYWTEGREHLAGLLALPGAQARTVARAWALNGAGRLACFQGDAGAARTLHEESLAIFRAQEDKRGIAWSLHGLANAAREQGDYVTARAFHEESLAIFRELGDKGDIAWSLSDFGRAARDQGDYGTARALLEESLAIFRETGEKQGIAWSLLRLGESAYYQGAYGAARAPLEESLAIFRELDHKLGIASTLRSLGKVARNQRDDGAARALLADSLAIFRELGDKRSIVMVLEGLAAVAVAQAHSERAARLFGAAEGLREAMGAPLPPAERAEHDRSAAAVRTALGEEAFAAAWAEGRAMSLVEGIAYASQGSSAP